MVGGYNAVSQQAQQAVVQGVIERLAPYGGIDESSRVPFQTHLVRGDKGIGDEQALHRRARRGRLFRPAVGCTHGVRQGRWLQEHPE